MDSNKFKTIVEQEIDKLITSIDNNYSMTTLQAIEYLFRIRHLIDEVEEK